MDSATVRMFNGIGRSASQQTAERGGQAKQCGQAGGGAGQSWRRIAALLAAGANGLLVALIVGRKASIMRFLLYPAAAALDATLLIHFQLNDCLATERLLLALGRTVP